MEVTRIVVTRTEPGATATANRLRQLGYEPVMLPLAEIRALAVAHIPAAEMFDAVAVTSANALNHTAVELIEAFRPKPCFAVGEGTASAAHKAGFIDIVTGTGDATALARIMSEALPGRARVLFLCGHVRSDALEQELRRSGIAVTALEIYDAPVIPYSEAAVASILGRRGVEAALLHSAKTAARLDELAGWPSIRPFFSATSYFCLSPRIGAALKNVAASRIVCAATPDEAELMALLRQRFG